MTDGLPDSIVEALGDGRGETDENEPDLANRARLLRSI
jgi:hypothetical protein